jgi:uridine kinase
VLLEGAYGPQPFLNDGTFALLVYVQTPLALRIVRRLRRDQQQRQRSARYVLRQTLLQTIPGERHFIRPLRDRADLVVHDPQRSVADVTEQIVRMLGAR